MLTKNIIKIKVLISIIILLGILCLPSGINASIGVTPVEIINKHAKPGDSFTKTFTISRNDPVIAVQVVVEPDLGEMDEWFSYQPGTEFVMEEGEKTKELTIIVNIPEDADYDSYEGYVRVKIMPVDTEEGGTVSIVEGVRLDMSLDVVEEDYYDLIVRYLNIDNVLERDPIKLLMRIENAGNAEASPSKVVINISDINKEHIKTLETDSIDSIEPYQTKEVYVEFDENDLSKGDYFANVKVYFDEEVLREETLFFGVLENVLPVTGEDQDTDNNFNSSLFLVGMIGGGVLLIIGVFLIINRIRKDKDEKDKSSKKKSKKSLKNEVKIKNIDQSLVIIVSILFSSAVLFASSFYYYRDFYSQSLLSKTAKLITKRDDNSNGNVLGVTESDIEDDAKAKASKYVNSNDETIYRVFSEPDNTSEVLYELKEGDKVDVKSSKGNWFKVLIEGKDGWISKGDVKDVEE